jgi:dTMP kinase
VADWLPQLAGRFIVFDGPDGSGKSTQFARFARHCRVLGLDPCEVREPGGTAIGEQIRRVLLDPANADLCLRSEMLLYMASRAQLVEQVIRPALAARRLVLADRFISSTLAYQGTAGGLPIDDILAVGRIAIGDTWPDLTIIFDADEQTALRRMTGSPDPGAGSRRRKSLGAGAEGAAAGLFADRMERQGAAYHRRVRQGYLDQASRDPQRSLLIDARPEPDAVFAALLDGLKNRFDRP